jgi:hypothetical protein
LLTYRIQHCLHHDIFQKKLRHPNSKFQRFKFGHHGARAPNGCSSFWTTLLAIPDTTAVRSNTLVCHMWVIVCMWASRVINQSRFWQILRQVILKILTDYQTWFINKSFFGQIYPVALIFVQYLDLPINYLVCQWLSALLSVVKCSFKSVNWQSLRCLLLSFNKLYSCLSFLCWLRNIKKNPDILMNLKECIMAKVFASLYGDSVSISSRSEIVIVKNYVHD